MDSYQYKITVGYPVYNVEKYVYKSLKSILDQDFIGYEVILVDDCSNDNSINIVLDLLASHPNGNIVNIIKHKENAGLSVARNTAIDNASGKYIYFVDSDDFIPANALSVLYKTAEEYNTDVVIGSNYQIKDGKTRKNILPHMEFLKKDDFKSYYYSNINDFIPDTSWNILFSMSFLNSYNLRFPRIRFHEDIAFGALYYPYIQRIAIISDLTYYYLIRYDSLMNLQHRELIGTNELSDAIELCEIIKSACLKWRNSPYYGGICAKTLKICFFQIAGILKHRDRFPKDIDNIIIKKMIKHPDSFWAIIHHKQLILYNIVFYLLGVFPKNLTTHLIYQICKRRGYLKAYYQKITHEQIHCI